MRRLANESVRILREDDVADRRRPASLRGYDVKAVSLLTSLDTGEETLVQQQFGEEVDVNTIMRRYGMTGAAPFGEDAGVYGDFTGIHDYDSAVARIDAARARFMELPASVREKFNNDPGELIRRANEMDEAELAKEFVVPDPPTDTEVAPPA